MMSLANQTVQDFFQEANWQGLKLIQNDPEATFIPSDFTEITVDCHLGLTVEEYFSLNNWQGFVRKQIYKEQTASVLESAPEFSLSMSVAEFCQRMVWQKQTKKAVKIASPLPVAEPKASPPPEAKKTFDFQDLSDLF